MKFVISRGILLFSSILIFILLSSTPTFSQTLTSTESLILKLQEQIQALQQQVTKLQSEVSSTKTELELVKTELKFTKALKLGNRGDEVIQLQEFLKQFPDIYPQGLVTGYFGPLTEIAVRKFQSKQGIESIGVVGPKTLSKLNELITEGAGKSDIIPPGLLIAPGVQKRLEPTATTTIPIIPITPATTTPSVATSTVSTLSTSSGQATTTPAGTTPVTPAISATPVSAATIATTQTPTPTPTPTITTTLYGSALNFDVSNLLEKIWGPGSNGIIVGGGLNFSTKPGFGWSQQYGGIFVTSYSIQGVQTRYLTQTNSVNVTVTGPAGSVIEVWDLESLTVVATNISNPGIPVIFTAQPNHRYGGFAWYSDNSQKDIAIFAAYSTSPPASTPITTSSLTISSISISAIETTESGAKATLTWVTNIPADSAVEYKESGAVGWTIWGGNGSIVTNHSETISLKISTVYSYIVRSIAGGVVSRSAEQTFKTPVVVTTITSTSDINPPTITFGDITVTSQSGSFNSVIINYVVKDDNGIAASNSKIDDIALASFATLSTSYTVDNASYGRTLSNGSHTLTVFARDTAGNSITKNLDFSLPLIATTSTATSTPSLASPSQNLSAISQMLNSLDEIIKQLSQILK